MWTWCCLRTPDDGNSSETQVYQCAITENPVSNRLSCQHITKFSPLQIYQLATNMHCDDNVVTKYEQCTWKKTIMFNPWLLPQLKLLTCVQQLIRYWLDVLNVCESCQVCHILWENINYNDDIWRPVLISKVWHLLVYYQEDIRGRSTNLKAMYEFLAPMLMAIFGASQVVLLIFTNLIIFMQARLSACMRKCLLVCMCQCVCL